MSDQHDEQRLEAVAANIVHQIGDVMYEALPEDVAHKYFVAARQATNDRAIDFAKGLISGYARDAAIEASSRRAPATTNRGAGADTWDAWRFYRRVRPQFADWNHVLLTYLDDDNPNGPMTGGDRGSKVVKLVDDLGQTLELCGVSFGYDGGTPTELLEVLLNEGFPEPETTAAVLNQTEDHYYPCVIPRDGR